MHPLPRSPSLSSLSEVKGSPILRPSKALSPLHLKLPSYAAALDLPALSSAPLLVSLSPPSPLLSSPSSPDSFAVHFASEAAAFDFALPAAPLLAPQRSADQQGGQRRAEEELGSPRWASNRCKTEEEEEGDKEAAHDSLFPDSRPPESSSFASTLTCSDASALSPTSPSFEGRTSSGEDDEEAELQLPRSAALGSACISAPVQRSPPPACRAGSGRRGTLFLSDRRIERSTSIDAPEPVAPAVPSIWQTLRTASTDSAEAVDASASSPSSRASALRKSRRSQTRFRSSSLQQFAHLFPLDSAPAASSSFRPSPLPGCHPLERSTSFSHSSSLSASLPCSRRPSSITSGAQTPESARSRALRRAPRRINWEEIRRCEEDARLPPVRWLSSEDRTASAQPVLTRREDERREDDGGRREAAGGRHPSFSEDWDEADPSSSSLAPVDSSSAGDSSSSSSSTSVQVLDCQSPAPSSCASVPLSSGAQCSLSPRARTAVPVSPILPSRAMAPRPRPPSLPRAPSFVERAQSVGGRGSFSSSAASPSSAFSEQLSTLLTGKYEQMQRFRGGLRGSGSGAVSSGGSSVSPLTMATHAEAEAELDLSPGCGEKGG